MVHIISPFSKMRGVSPADTVVIQEDQSATPQRLGVGGLIITYAISVASAVKDVEGPIP